MKTFKSIRSLLILACFSSVTAQSPPSGAPAGTGVSLSASVEPKRVPLNRTAELTVRLTWEGALDSLMISEVEEPVLSNLEITGTSTSNRVEGTAGGSKSVKEIAYTFRPKSLGMGYIDSIRVAYEDLRSGVVHQLRTQRLSVEVVDPLPETGGRSRLWLWAALIVCFAAGVLGGAAFFLKSRARKPHEAAPVPKPAEETFLESLKVSIGPGDPGSGNSREAFAPLSKLFRQYLSEKFKIAGLEATTQELIHALRQSGVEDGLLRKCKAFFEKADVIKFSGQKASQAEFDDAYTTVESVLESKLAEERLREQALREEALKQAREKGGWLKRLIRRNS
jgi:hypothetical protein